MSYFNRIASEFKNLSRVERVELFASCLGLVVDVASILGFIGVLSAVPGSSAFHAREDFFVVLVGIAFVYSLGPINSFLFRRYRESPLARPYYWRRVRGRSILDDPKMKIEGEWQDRLLLAGLITAPVLIAYVWMFPDEPYILGSHVGDAILLSMLSGIVVVPLVAAVGKSFEMVLAALSGPPT